MLAKRGDGVVDVGVVRGVEEWVGEEAVDDLPCHLELRAEPSPTLSALFADGHLLRLQPAVDHLLVAAVDAPEVAPVAVDVHSDVGNDDALVVWVVRCVLDVHAHHSPDELDVWTQRPVGPKNGRDRQRRVVETLAEHLNLDDRVQGAGAEIAEDLLLILLTLSRVDLADVQTTLLVEPAYLACVIEGAGDGDELMIEAALAKLGEPLDRGVDDRDVALPRERDAA